MNIIIFSHKPGRTRSFDLGHPLALTALAVAGALVLGGVFTAGLRLGEHNSPLAADPQHWGQILAQQKSEIADLRARVQARVDAMAGELGVLDAHILRIDALGKRLTSLGNLDKRTFNFDTEPLAAAAGFADTAPGTAAPGLPDLSSALSRLEQQVDLRDAQLSALENVLVDKKSLEAVHPEGRPVDQGRISSYFGERKDPFDGEGSFHEGIDFAGQFGEPLHAVAAGVVTWAGPRTTYGNMVEIDHGNGYVTRYAHAEKVLVSIGQMVSRGQEIALMGSTGRSTGPHVHFEVRRDGHAINPLSFVNQQPAPAG
ncbi:MAG TPA: M23 family metallopeptidase [Steroidobacteraceae bacterium]|nr:M23 family metallopeptidase [Steroidobacteraceae bacterium]